MKQFNKHLVLFLIGGISYFIIEILWRGYSYISMFILGGICFLFIGMINEYFTFETPLWKQQLIATIVVTILEFVTGLIVNMWLGLHIWDYSNMRFNLLGQICLEYSILWFLLSGIGIIVDDLLRWKLFGEKMEKYRII